jgi:tetratricopeptide (TPR) repeat protein
VRGLQRLASKQYDTALADFQVALTPPDNLRAEPGGASRLAEVSYWIGCAYEGMGDRTKACDAWTAAITVKPPAPQRGGGGSSVNLLSTRSTQQFYQACARQKLADSDAAEKEFRDLIASGTSALAQAGKPAPAADPNAPPAPPEPPRVRTATAHYMMGLGYAGLGKKEKAREEFDTALANSPDYLSAEIARGQL